MGDLDCDAAVGAIDGLKLLRHDATLSVPDGTLPGSGADVMIDGSPRVWGDIDCDANCRRSRRAEDAAPRRANLSVSQMEPCPDPNDDIIVAEP